jgi:hypothetical protein
LGVIAKKGIPNCGYILIEFDHQSSPYSFLGNGGKTDNTAAGKWLNEFFVLRVARAEPLADIGYEPGFAARIPKRTSLRHRSNVYDFRLCPTEKNQLLLDSAVAR